MKLLIIIRGVSGSGKSTLAEMISRTLTPFGHVEADQYFVNPNGDYIFNPNLLHQAHDWCVKTVESHIQTDHTVIVSNTFTRKWEIDPYIKLAKEYGYQVQLITCEGQFQNVHNVPDEVVQKMRDRFEHLTLKDFGL